MAIKLKIPSGNPGAKPGKGWLPRDPLLQAALVVFLVVGTLGAGFFTYYYVKFGRMIDQRFKGPVFGNSARIYAISRPVQVGEKIEPQDIALQLRRAGYSDKDGQIADGQLSPVRRRNRDQARSGFLSQPRIRHHPRAGRQGGQHQQQIGRAWLHTNSNRR